MRDKLPLTILFFFLIFMKISVVNADDSLFVYLKEKLETDYRKHSKDTNRVSMDSLLRWKRRINFLVESPQYPAIRKEFYSHQDTFNPSSPIEIVSWYLSRTSAIRKTEDSLRINLLHYMDATVDSLTIAQARMKHPPSAADFSSIPFGISRDIFLLIAQTSALPIIPLFRDTVWVEHHLIGDVPFTVACIFTKGKNKRYHRYEIAGYAFPPESLYTAVWPQASNLVKHFSSLMGKPIQLNRISRFDIKKDSLSIMAQWRDSISTVQVTIGMRSRSYFAGASVTEIDSLK